MAALATVPREACSLCLEEEAVSIRIGGDPICEPCIHDGIIPRFIAAFKHEAEYPPTFGRHRLHLADFKQFIADGDEFFAAFWVKEMEYLTPINKRLYCQQCQAFVCEKSGRKLVCLCCLECDTLICEACGTSAGNIAYHECPKPSDAFDGLVQGKDYQICPSKDCCMKVELKDGCNSMRCTSSSCNQEFCFICGGPFRHGSGHWNAGGTCPRFNQPGSQHAQFDRARPAGHREREPEQAQAGAEAVLREFADPQALEMRQIMGEIDWLDVSDMTEVTHVMRRLMLLVDATPLPEAHPRDNHPVGRLVAEASIAVALHATPLGTLMQHQQNQLTDLTRVVEARIADVHALRLPPSELLTAARDVLVKLRLNLDLYVWRQRLQIGLEHFERRHEELRRVLFDEHRELVARWLPIVLRVWYTYQWIAEARMGAARRARQAEQDERARLAAMEVEEEL